MTYTLSVVMASCVAASALGGSLLRYLLAYATCPLIFTFIAALESTDSVEYDTGHMLWPLHRMNLYATLRVGASLLPEEVDRLALVLVAATETLGMLVHGRLGGSFGYRFSTSSLDFVHYAVVKTSVFLFLPLLERLLAQTL